MFYKENLFWSANDYFEWPSFFVSYLYNSGRLNGMEQKIDGMFDVNLTKCQKMIQKNE